MDWCLYHGRNEISCMGENFQDWEAELQKVGDEPSLLVPSEPFSFFFVSKKVGTNFLVLFWRRGLQLSGVGEQVMQRG